jgi:hypothetical protein
VGVGALAAGVVAGADGAEGGGVGVETTAGVGAGAGAREVVGVEVVGPGPGWIGGAFFLPGGAGVRFTALLIGCGVSCGATGRESGCRGIGGRCWGMLGPGWEALLGAAVKDCCCFIRFDTTFENTSFACCIWLSMVWSMGRSKMYLGGAVESKVL